MNNYIDVEICPTDENIIVAEIEGYCIQCSLHEEQNLSHKECVDQFRTAVNICGLDEDSIKNHMRINNIDCEIEIYK